MSRIGFIREVVEKNGGRVGVHYANGPGGFGGYSLQGPNREKVIYKVGVHNRFQGNDGKVVTSLVNYPNIVEQLTGNNGIERVYFSDGYMRVIFSERAPQFKRN